VALHEVKGDALHGAERRLVSRRTYATNSADDTKCFSCYRRARADDGGYWNGRNVVEAGEVGSGMTCVSVNSVEGGVEVTRSGLLDGSPAFVSITMVLPPREIKHRRAQPLSWGIGGLAYEQGQPSRWDTPMECRTRTVNLCLFSSPPRGLFFFFCFFFFLFV